MNTNPTNKVAVTAGEISSKPRMQILDERMNLLIRPLMKLGRFTRDLDYHVTRASMVVIYFFFGFLTKRGGLIPFISNGPRISWMYPPRDCGRSI
jgi:hypothetical protein